MNLTSTGKKFSCVTSTKHYDAFREIMPDGTRFLVDENPDIRAFLKQGIPLRTDVAVVDKAGFCAL